MATVKIGKRRAITAAAMLPTYERTQGGLADEKFHEYIDKAGLKEIAGDWWPTDSVLTDMKGQLFRDGDRAVYQVGEAIVLCHVGHGDASIRVAAASKETAYKILASFRGLYPATFITTSDDPKVPITFWSLGAHGPERRLRRIDASPWGDIEQNYTASVRGELASLMTEFEPGKSGQLMLWQGPPGTGKTWALRALASEWAAWAEFHYITDPDAFFVESASYLVEVLLADSYSAIEEVSGDIYDEQDEKGKWRVLILEDTGELLSAHAKEKYGQGLSRLLNVVDGMIGQGLRVLVVVTTNDELGELNPAVLRPGRCASQIVFAPLTPEEIAAWGSDADDATTIAELYARGKKGEDALEEDDALVASIDPELRDSIAAVAEAHQEEAEGYGDTAYDPETRTVLYVAGDWTDPDPIEADMLAIDGVDAFVSEAEGMPDGWCDAEVVYGSQHSWCNEDAALVALVSFAAEPILLDPEPDEPIEETAPAVLAAAAVAEKPDASLALAHRTLDVLTEFARRPSDPAPDVHVHLPAHALSVAVERQTPDLHVDATTRIEEGAFSIAAPEQPVHVDVHVPEHPTPDVYVTNEVPAAEVSVIVEAPKPTVAVPIRNGDGEIVRVEHHPSE